jgi:hypothetical protein
MDRARHLPKQAEQSKQTTLHPKVFLAVKAATKRRHFALVRTDAINNGGRA